MPDVHVVNAENAHLYTDELDQHFRRRHDVFVGRRGWSELQRPDGRDIDEFDDETATHLLIIEGGEVVAGSRLHPHTAPTLLSRKFARLANWQLPPMETSLDWTRLYVLPRGETAAARMRVSRLMYCAIMQYALEREMSAITFVGYLSLIEVFGAIGWRTTPLGMPEVIDGRATLAAGIAVDEAALFSALAAAGRHGSVLTGRCLVSGGPATRDAA
ncbi:GNAT family N-acetyltransferase [Jiella endophytica]|uniref:Acyl-homoserine-lactone synthase n=1 Tax=Jiella endophytica TaxID=2558362 RepID=A0A4Y8RG76_9HYPH|nr:acyl-homoserine-lactone synthase [Jiella endophytica]TFF20838.1 GNAT family N-acetyltransferase [Jiella endophytica]